MKLTNAELRDRLASEYVLGTLTGRARTRFQSFLRYDPALRALVARWEERLAPLAGAGADVAPPERVWRALEGRIRGGERRATGWQSLAIWRTLAAAGAAFSLALAVVIGMTPRAEPPMSMVTVMSDDAGQPAMVVAWPPMESMRDPHVRVRIVQDHPTMPTTSSWELWLLPGGSAAPVSMGLVSLDAEQVIKLPRALVSRMAGAWGMALSLEPHGGSPTGAPTGPVLFKGQCLRII